MIRCAKFGMRVQSLVRGHGGFKWVGNGCTTLCLPSSSVGTSENAQPDRSSLLLRILCLVHAARAFDLRISPKSS
eukprot:scaffold31844_cov27-Tisochrysis_lutea.AAC.1